MINGAGKAHRPGSGILALAIAIAGGCSGAKPSVESHVSPSATVAASASVKSLDPRVVSVVAVKEPAGLIIDGNLTEWGPFIPDPQSPDESPRLDPGPAPDGTNKPGPVPVLANAPNPPGAPSRLAFAVTPAALLVAIRVQVTHPPSDVWLGIGTPPPTLPIIGKEAGTGYTRELQCEFAEGLDNDGVVVHGSRNPAGVVQACEDLKVQHERFKAQHRARFVRRVKFSAAGAYLVTPDGTSTLVESAKVVTHSTPDGVTIEASLPLSVMPYLTDVPLQWLRVAARLDQPLKDDVAATAWRWAKLPEVVRFEPHAELRERMFALILAMEKRFPTALSFHPTSASHVHSVRYAKGDHRVLVDVDQVLYERRATIGDVEVGLARAYSPALAIFKTGELVNVALNRDGAGPEVDGRGDRILRGTVDRSGELHVFSFSPLTYGGWAGMIPPHWTVHRIAVDGSIVAVEELAASTSDIGTLIPDSVEEIADATFSRFGWRSDRGEPREGVEALWQWDPVKKVYASTVRRVHANHPNAGQRPALPK